MSGKQFRFVFGVCLLATLLFIAGELLMIFVFRNETTVLRRVWTILIVVGALIFNLIKCPRK